MTMKRFREDNVEIEALAMANCLMLLSRVDAGAQSTAGGGRVFECKTCSRKFASFQALGGHRASHKKPKLLLLSADPSAPLSSPPKPKTHECSICGVEFPIGQALGGHMRRHRAALSEGLAAKSHHHQQQLMTKAAVLKKSPSIKRVFGLDLNLMPYENDLNLKLGSTMLSPALS